MESDSIAPLFKGWELLQGELTALVKRTTPEQLGWRASEVQWPIWASIGHLAACRVYWLCHVFNEPGADTTPFRTYGDDPGWEDDLSQPRGADELLWALESSWAIVESTLGSWTLPMLDKEFVRTRSDGIRQAHTRQSVLFRMLTHDAVHAGSISEVLGMHGLPELDLWSGLSREI